MNVKKISVVLLALLILGFIGFFGFRQFEKSKFIDTSLPIVKMISLHTAQVLETTNESSSMTFAEAFKKSERALSDIDSKILELKAANVPLSMQEATGAVLEYAKACQELIRQIDSLTRKGLQASSKLEWAKRMQDSATNSRTYNEYMWDSAKKNSAEATDALKAFANEHQNVEGKANAVVEARKKLTTNFPKDSLIEEGAIEKLVAHAKKQIESIK